MKVKLELPDPNRKPGEVRWKIVEMPGAPRSGDYLYWDGEELVVQAVMWTPQERDLDLLVICVE